MSRSFSVLLFMAGAATASVLFLALHHQRRRQRHQTAPSISQSSHSVSSLPPSLEHELFARVVSFFGEESFPPIQKAFVVVVGLGGVGSHAAHMLVRSGVQRIRVIDFDQVGDTCEKESLGMDVIGMPGRGIETHHHSPHI